MVRTLSLSALGLATLLAVGSAVAAPANVSNGALVDSKGMTLYTFDKDSANSGKSVCNGQCATNWPPLMVQSGAKSETNWSMVMRDDGMKQWAYKGQPVYTWVKDKAAGDRTGDGVGGVWHTAKP